MGRFFLLLKGSDFSLFFFVFTLRSTEDWMSRRRSAAEKMKRSYETWIRPQGEAGPRYSHSPVEPDGPSLPVQSDSQSECLLTRKCLILQGFVSNWTGRRDKEEEEEEEEVRRPPQRHQHVEEVSEGEGQGAAEDRESQSEEPPPQPAVSGRRRRGVGINRPAPQSHWLNRRPRFHPSGQCGGLGHRPGLFVRCH